MTTHLQAGNLHYASSKNSDPATLAFLHVVGKLGHDGPNPLLHQAELVSWVRVRVMLLVVRRRIWALYLPIDCLLGGMVGLLLLLLMVVTVPGLHLRTLVGAVGGRGCTCPSWNYRPSFTWHRRRAGSRHCVGLFAVAVIGRGGSNSSGCNPVKDWRKLNNSRSEKQTIVKWVKICTGPRAKPNRGPSGFPVHLGGIWVTCQRHCAAF